MRSPSGCAFRCRASTSIIWYGHNWSVHAITMAAAICGFWCDSVTLSCSGLASTSWPLSLAMLISYSYHGGWRYLRHSSVYKFSLDANDAVRLCLIHWFLPCEQFVSYNKWTNALPISTTTAVTSSVSSGVQTGGSGSSWGPRVGP